MYYLFQKVLPIYKIYYFNLYLKKRVRLKTYEITYEIRIINKINIIHLSKCNKIKLIEMQVIISND